MFFYFSILIILILFDFCCSNENVNETPRLFDLIVEHWNLKDFLNEISKDSNHNEEEQISEHLNIENNAKEMNENQLGLN